MKFLNKITTFIALLLIIVIQFFIMLPVPKAYAATSPTLTDSSSYSVLSGTTVTNTGATSVSGNVGISPAGGGGYAESGSTTYGAGSSLHDADVSAANAQADNLTAYGALSAGSNATCTDGLYQFGTGNIDLAGKSLVPGVYCADTFSLSGTLTLNDTGAPDGVWIFRSAATVITSSGIGAKVQFLTGVGLPCNVWWKVVSSATIGVGTTFIGNILASTAIQLQTSATLNGRAFAYTAAVTMDSNTISGPTCSATPTATPTPTSSSTSSSGGSSSTSTASCPDLSSQIVAPTIIDSKRVNAESISINWGPYSGIDTFNVRFGPENGNWLYSTNVTGFSTTLNALPFNQALWFQVAARNDCRIGNYGEAKLVGGQIAAVNPNVLGVSFPDTGFAPRQNNLPWYVSVSIFAGISALFVLIQRKHKSS